ncbi:MAG: hypothetical protein K2I49_03420, partial [Ureaplasma sp.]|nr:hypothetical protein [Ureaplasma sp.]
LFINPNLFMLSDFKKYFLDLYPKIKTPINVKSNKESKPHNNILFLDHLSSHFVDKIIIDAIVLINKNTAQNPNEILMYVSGVPKNNNLCQENTNLNGKSIIKKEIIKNIVETMPKIIIEFIFLYWLLRDDNFILFVLDNAISFSIIFLSY